MYINNTLSQLFLELVQNPAGDNIPFMAGNQDKVNVSARLFSNTGQLLKGWELGKVEGHVALLFNGARPGEGCIYCG